MTESTDGLPATAPRTRLALLVVGVLEAVSLVVLLVNIAAGNNQSVAAAVGPVHGLFWLSGVVLTWLSTANPRARLLAFIPAIGALLALRFSRPAPD